MASDVVTMVFRVFREVGIMDKIFWISLAFLAGSLIPLQGAFNARLGAAGASLMHASLISFVIGTLAIAAYVVATRQTVSWAGFASAPWYTWFGGFCGAFSLTSGLSAIGPRIGFRVTGCGATYRFCPPRTL